MLVPGAVAILFGALLAALVVAFIVRADFRTAVLGSPGEATVFGVISVKGVVIVLLCAMLTAGVLYPLRTLPTTAPANPPAPPPPTKMRLDVNFDPDEVNPRRKDFEVRAYVRTKQGNLPIPVIHQVTQGGVTVTVELPDMETPFFVEFQTAGKNWTTDDFSVREAKAIARKLEE
jgi:hypothetical protein